MRIVYGAMICLMAAAVGVFTACSSGDDTVAPPSLITTQMLSADDNATQEFVVASTNPSLEGTRISIPAGTLGEDTEFVIQEGSVDEQFSAGMASKVIRVTASKELNGAITLRIPVTLTGDQTIDDIEVMKLPEGETVPQLQTITARNADPAWVEVEQSSFSFFWGRTPVPGEWEPTNTSSEPSPRTGHTAVWTGSEMIIWGGVDANGYTNSGGRYNPETNQWSSVSTANAPTAREAHSAIWTGDHMIVWGGSQDGGGIYTPSNDSWSRIEPSTAVPGRNDHSVAWTGSRMVVWGGTANPNSGGVYDLGANSWTAMSSQGLPEGRGGHVTATVGNKMYIWGGQGGSTLNTGASFDFSSNQWQNMPAAPSGMIGRRFAEAVVVGSKIVIWGGADGSNNPVNSGAIFDTSNGSWQMMNSTNAPAGRIHFTATAIGSKVYVFGGSQRNTRYLSDGGVYDLDSNKWSPMQSVGGLSARASHTAVTDGENLIIWGGGLNGPLSAGGSRYDPDGDVTPGVPTSVSVSPAAGGIRVNFGTVSKATQYRIYYSRNPNFTTKTYATTEVAGTVVTGLVDDQTYYVVVSALRGGVEGKTTDPVSGVAGLPAPQNVMVTPGYKKAYVTWDALEGNSFTEVLWSENPDGSHAQSQTSSTSSSHTIHNLINGKTYWVRVRGRFPGNEIGSESANFPVTPAILAPEGFSLRENYEQLEYSWNQADGAEKYRLYYSDDASMANETMVEISGGSTLSAIRQNLTNGTTYYAQLSVVDEDDIEGPRTSILSGVPRLRAPEMVVMEDLNMEVNPSWGAVTGAVKYRVVWYTQQDMSDQMMMETTNTSFSLPDVSNGTTYYVVITAIDANDVENSTMVLQATPRLPAPSIYQSGGGKQSFNVLWGQVSGAEGYRIVYSENEDLSDSSNVALPASPYSYTVEGLKDNTTYYFVVRAIGPNSDGLDSEVESITTNIQAPVLSAIVGNGTVELTWTDVPGAVRYNLFAVQEGFVDLHQDMDASSPTTFTDLQNGKQYLAQVTAYDASNNTGISEPIGFTPGLPAPTGISATPSVTSIQFSWTNVTSATGYDLFYSETSGEDLEEMTKVENLTSGSSVDNLKPDTTYYYRLVAKDATHSGMPSAEMMVKTMPVPVLAAPQNVMASGGEMEATVSWDAVLGATEYTLYISLDDTFTTSMGLSVPVQVGNVLTYTFNTTNTPTLIPGDHYFIVVAKDSTRTSVDSQRVMATILAPLDPPTNLMATPGDGEVSLTWEAVQGATGYTVYHDISASISSMTSTPSSAGTNSATVTGLMNNTLYHFIVTATDGTRTSMDSQFVTATPVSAVQAGWSTMTSTGAPSARTGHTAVWTGSEMIVWGGVDSIAQLTNTGGHYNPSSDSWAATGTGANVPSARKGHTAVFTGSSATAAINNKMIVWGGDINQGFTNTGGVYDVATKTWTAMTTTNAPAVRTDHKAFWTGDKMIVWGGIGSQTTAINTGGVYDPVTDSWTAISMTNAPDAPNFFSAVWTGTEMIVWGGYDDFLVALNSGGRYNPSTNTWTATDTTGAPIARDSHTAVWSGTEMIVWGGTDQTLMRLDNGGRYNPSTNTWNANATQTTGAPNPRFDQIAIWTGSKMVIWGGNDGMSSNALNDGASYDPSNDSWTATPITGAPTGVAGAAAVWTGSSIIIWGGVAGQSGPVNTGAILVP